MTCVVDDCDGVAGTARGLCKKHYMRWYRHGDVHYRPPTAKARFWGRVDKTGECWVWRGAIGHNGYGASCMNGRQISAHRMAYILVNGEIPNQMYVCHSCDNKICVNPSHLFLGTPKDNMTDKVKKGRQARGRKLARLQKLGRMKAGRK